MAAGGMSAPGFTGAGLDRADHLRLDEERLAAMLANGDARLLGLAELDPVLDEAGRLHWTALTEGEETIFLGLEEGVPLFAPLVRTEAFGQRAWSVFRLLALMSPRDAAIWGAARSLNEWHNRHRFCSVCGAATASFRAGWGRRCDGCGAEHFPRVDPVVIMLAEHDRRVLVGRQPQYPAGRYSALSGFVEPGESIEEAVARELMEEAGVAVDGVRYVASQPWPFPGSLMIACIGRAESDALTLDRNELEDAFWVGRDGVAAALAGDPQAPFLAPPAFAIANTLLKCWIDGE
jgi:NAD+ diphosphatase